MNSGPRFATFEMGHLQLQEARARGAQRALWDSPPARFREPESRPDSPKKLKFAPGGIGASETMLKSRVVGSQRNELSLPVRSPSIAL